jgi:DNA repair exonuclease SbcCD ATPase subunit
MSSQATLGDDELFGEAAAEMRADVEDHLEAARAELPASDEVWEADADNVLGVLNGLKSSLDVGDAAAELRQAKKWYVIGTRAEAFDDADDLEAEIEALEELVETVAEAREQVAELTGVMPGLRGALQDAESAAADADEGEDEDADEDEE